MNYGGIYMNIPSTTKIEHRAINALETLIDEHLTMDHQINGNDKEMAWDGYIWLYKNNNGKQDKSNLHSRVPVQVKGHNDSKHEYINKKRITYKVDINDLRAYATEKGVLYFQIFVDERKSSIFYASLYPSKIATYLEEIECKGNKETYSIPFTKLERNVNALYSVVLQFSEEAMQQGSAYNPLVQNRIRVDEFEKLTNINWKVVGNQDPQSILSKFSAGDICLYGKTKDDKFSRPIEFSENIKVFLNNAVQQPVCIGEKTFYEKYDVISDTDGNLNLKFSPNLSFSFMDNRFRFDLNSSLRDLSNDAEFMLALCNHKSLSIANHNYKELEPELDDAFENQLKELIELRRILENLGMDIDIPFKKYSEEDKNAFLRLTNFKRRVIKEYPDDEFVKYVWKFQGKLVPLIYIRDKHVDIIVNSIFTKEYGVYISDEGSNSRAYKVPLFGYHDVDVLSNLYNVDYQLLKQQIDESEINKKTADALNDCALRLINVFDRNGDKEFLKLAEYLLEKIKPYIEKELYLLNAMQIKKRLGCFDEDDIKDVESINSDNEMVLFGKNVLLGRVEEARLNYDSFTIEMKKAYEKYPIFTLFEGVIEKNSV